ncbi:MAG: type I pullulanase [Spirochaetes bacterium]|nr:type I pullulanase [Spirochaetota bacterium]
MKIFSVTLLLLICINSAEAETVTVHYYRFIKDYAEWNLWIWPKGADGRMQKADGSDAFGMIFKIDPGALNGPEEIGFIIRKGNWESKDIDRDRFLNVKKDQEFWLIQGDENIYSSKPSLTPKIVSAVLDGKDTVKIILSKKVNSKEINPNTVKILNKNKKPVQIKKIFKGYIIQPIDSFNITLKEDLTLSDDQAVYTVQIKGFQEKNLMMGKVLSDNKFYSKKDLGVLYKKEASTFRIFAPTAVKVSLQIYQSVTDTAPETFFLNKDAKGIWEATVSMDLHGKYYTYKVYLKEESIPKEEVVDIYSKCNTGKYNRGMIIDDKTPVSGSPGFNISDSIIYELHIRDFTIDKNSGIKNRGKFLGMTESGKKFNGFSTGLDHLSDLGVNVVQIMPIQDFDNNEEDQNTYNWGYMPSSFNSPDGWFASDSKDDSRVREFKKAVDVLHKKGIKVTMDVVYNHTSPNASFQKIVPDYYFRMKPDGSFYNGSGCGNEFQTEFPMAQKYILDSLKYWVKEYKIDGFRFDLMGLIDIGTMTLIAKELKKINKNILVYGEPWSAGETPTKQTLKGTQKGKGFSVFNDHFRDSIKGSVFNMDPGYIQGKADGDTVTKIKKGITGSIDDFTLIPLESINYVACHDNHTLWDRINLSLKQNNDPANDNEKIKRNMQKLAGALVLLSQGIPFLHSGQEMCRSKKGDENSYNKDDSVNQIYWNLKEEYNDVFQYYKGLIAIRKAHPAFKLKKGSTVKKELKFIDAPYGCIAWRIKDRKDKWKDILILINPHRTGQAFSLPSGSWKQVVNEEKAGNSILKRSIMNKIDVAPVSLAVVYK